jgi:hypothetical protein
MMDSRIWRLLIDRESLVVSEPRSLLGPIAKQLGESTRHNSGQKEIYAVSVGTRTIIGNSAMIGPSAADIDRFFILHRDLCQ